MFCFLFTHFLPLFMPGRTHQSKNTASQTQPQALHHPTTSPPSSHQDPSRSLWTPLHLPTLLLLLRQLFISLSPPSSECFWPWLNCRRGCSWPSHATPAEPGCPQPGGYHTIYCAKCKKKQLRLHLFCFSKSKCYITGEPSHWGEHREAGAPRGGGQGGAASGEYFVFVDQQNTEQTQRHTEHRTGTQNTDRVKIKFLLINRTLRCIPE